MPALEREDIYHNQSKRRLYARMREKKRWFFNRLKRHQAAVTFQAVEKPLDFVAVFVRFFVERGRLGAVRNHHVNAFLRAISPVFVVVARVGKDLAGERYGSKVTACEQSLAWPPMVNRRTLLLNASVQAWLLVLITPRLRPRHSRAVALFVGRRVGAPEPRSNRA